MIEECSLCEPEKQSLINISPNEDKCFENEFSLLCSSS